MMLWQAHPNTAHAKKPKAGSITKGISQRGRGRRELTALFQAVLQLQELQGAGREGCELLGSQGIPLGCRVSSEEQGLKQSHCGELFPIGTKKKAGKGIL